MMEVRFANKILQRLEQDIDFTAGFAKDIVRAFRMRMQFIRAATDERAFYAMKSLHFEKLHGDRKHQHSMRLNSQWRLIIEIEKGQPKNRLVIVEIVDYH
ncbi:MAG: type II toxin-antitoxin system RelE/ParE family toxin [Planctomycetaceae bacterium]